MVIARIVDKKFIMFTAGSNKAVFDKADLIYLL